MADIAVVSCSNRHASLGKWVYEASPRLLPRARLSASKKKMPRKGLLLHRVHGIQAVAIDDPVDCHPDCHTGGLYKTGLTDQRPT